MDVVRASTPQKGPANMQDAEWTVHSSAGLHMKLEEYLQRSKDIQSVEKKNLLFQGLLGNVTMGNQP